MWYNRLVRRRIHAGTRVPGLYLVRPETVPSPGILQSSRPVRGSNWIRSQAGDAAVTPTDADADADAAARDLSLCCDTAYTCAVSSNRLCDTEQR